MKLNWATAGTAHSNQPAAELKMGFWDNIVQLFTGDPPNDKTTKIENAPVQSPSVPTRRSHIDSPAGTRSGYIAPDAGLNLDSKEPYDMLHLALSPSQDWVVGTMDGDYDQLRAGTGFTAGQRSGGNGLVRLVHRGSVVWESRLARPNDAVVSDTGIVAVCDWLHTGELKGTFVVFKADGNKLASIDVDANLLDCGISTDGLVAWCTTAGNRDSPESSNVVIVVDTQRGAEQFRFDRYNDFIGRSAGELLSIGRTPSGYQAVFEKIRPLEFDSNGTWVNQAEIRSDLEEAVAESGSGYELFELAQSKLDGRKPAELPSELQREVDSLLKKACNEQISDYTHAQILRLRGEVAEAMDNPHAAVKHYAAALNHHPKIGVKRRLSKLRSQLGQ